jgi:hypothetical protein
LMALDPGCCMPIFQLLTRRAGEHSPRPYTRTSAPSVVRKCRQERYPHL